jgi:hypothetical protein
VLRACAARGHVQPRRPPRARCVCRHSTPAPHTPTRLALHATPPPQAFEKATGKSSSHNREAFRAALVSWAAAARAAQRSGARRGAAAAQQRRGAGSQRGPARRACARDGGSRRSRSGSLPLATHKHPHTPPTRVTHACVYTPPPPRSPTRWSAACSTSPPSRSMALWRASTTTGPRAARSSRT